MNRFSTSKYFSGALLLRRWFFVYSLLAIVLGGNAFAQQAGSTPVAGKPLHFMVFGDWGTGNAQQKSVAEAMARYAEKCKAGSPVEFVISTGDNFYEIGVSDVHDPQWQTKFEQMYDRKRLPMPFISVLGNHDWGNDPSAQIAYAGAYPKTRWQMDGFWFKRSYPLGASEPLADFFYIDTNLWNYNINRLQDRQMKWLTENLKNSKAKWQIVVGHHPFYSDGDHGRDKDVLALRERLAPLFKEAGVDAYLAGHDHDLQRIVVPDHPTLFLISGAAGKLRPREFNDWKPFYQSTPGFAAITLTPTQLRGQFLGDDGKVLDSWQIAPVPPQTVKGEVASTPAVDVKVLKPLSVTLGEQITGSGLTIPSDADGVHQAVKIGDVSARRPNGQYLYVAINDKAYRGPLDLWVTVEAFPNGGARPTLHYDKDAGAPSRETRYARAEGVWTPLENGWQRGVFFLPSTRLAKGQNLDADFRLSGKGVAVRRIEVSPRSPQ